MEPVLRGLVSTVRVWIRSRVRPRARIIRVVRVRARVRVIGFWGSCVSLLHSTFLIVPALSLRCNGF
jgi:hypothetical protein